MKITGDDYQHMIDDTKKKVLQKPMNKFKSLSSQVNLLASAEGFNLKEIQACELVGFSINCDR